jgi:hypothetical protein
LNILTFRNGWRSEGRCSKILTVKQKRLVKAKTSVTIVPDKRCAKCQHVNPPFAINLIIEATESKHNRDIGANFVKKNYYYYYFVTFTW